MYSYYFLASFPQYRKYLWWKKYLTVLQLTQFTINLCFLANFFIHPGMCEFPHWMPKFSTFYMISFLVLFGNFYMTSYIKSKYFSPATKPVRNGEDNNNNSKPMLNGKAANGTEKKSV